MKKNFVISIPAFGWMNICLSAVLVFLLANLDKTMLSLKYLEFEKFRKEITGATLVNETPFSVKIKDDYKIMEIPPYKSSKDIGIRDVDLLIVESPIVFEGKEYKDGVIRFCDTITLKVYSENGITYAKPSFSYYILKKFRNIGWHSPYYYLRYQSSIFKPPLIQTD